MMLVRLCLAVVLTAVAAGCSRTVPEPGTTGRPAPATVIKPGAFSQDQLLADARELARTIEDTHPDPYTAGGVVLYELLRKRTR